MLIETQGSGEVAGGAAPVRSQIGGGRLQNNPEPLKRWLAGQVPGPLTIEVAPVNGCNHGCLHCYPLQLDLFGARKKFLPTEHFRPFLADFRAMGGEEVYFAGTGEPLLHPDLADLIAHGHALGLRMAFSSNGVLLTPANAARILPHTAWARFSVNGGDAATYAHVHACHERDFSRLIHNLENALTLRRQEGWPVQLALQCVVWEANWRSIPDLVALHERLGTDKVVLRNRFDREGTKHPVHPEAIPLLEAAARVPGIEVRWESFLRADETLQADWRRCHGPHFRTHMDYQGNLFACCRHFYKESAFGNINDRRFPEIWRSVERHRLFAEIARGDDIPLCCHLCPTAFDNVVIEQALTARGLGLDFQPTIIEKTAE
ncbi:MAG: radical SAM protein [Magnetococcales bacterium]|nr:radical SAM protein [Magnetococcales bacterium]